jgi:uncharacterized protein YabN with tetrapyrrole methylase and pyrophosphatase domain
MTAIYLAGLGIRGVDQITPEAERAIQLSREVLYLDTGVATRRFLERMCPRVTPLFEQSYAEGAPRMDAYRHMAASVVAAALDHPPVTFAIQGHPLIGVYAPFLVLRMARELGLEAVVLPGVSALDAIAADLRIDPCSDGLQMFEATDLLLRGRPLQPDVPALLWQIGAVETSLHTTRSSRPERFARLRRHLLEYYPPDHEVAAVYCSPHPLMPALTLRFPLERIADYAAELHPGYSLFIPAVLDRPVVDRELLASLDSREHLRAVTR